MKGALLAAFVLSACSPAQEGRESNRGSGVAAFPTLEPFLDSRMWPMLRLLTETAEGDPYPPDCLERLLGAWGGLRDIQGEAADVAGVPAPSPRAAFEATSSARGAWLQLVPFAMERLSALWSADVWSGDQLALARGAETFFSQHEGPPKLSFEEGERDANQAQLGALADWFRAEVARSAVYARMILTIDDGPFRGLPHPATTLLPDASRLRVADHLELRLHVDSESADPWVLQAVRDGEPLWTKVVSEVPATAGLTFEGVGPPRRVGPYGWKGSMRFGYPGDIEAAIFYLDTDGELLFYFTTW